jgi:hypothetical protein
MNDTPSLQPNLAHPITVVVGASCTDDNVDGPRFATFRVDNAFLERTSAVEALLETHDLCEVRIEHEADWGPGEDVDQMEQGKLCIGRSGLMWFIDYPDHACWDVETELINLADLREAVKSAPAGEPLFLTDDDSVRDAYTDAQLAEDDGATNLGDERRPQRQR